MPPQWIRKHLMPLVQEGNCNKIMKDLEYHLKIIPAQAGQPWSALLEGNGVVLRFSSLLELARYLEVAAQRQTIIEVPKFKELIQ